MSRTQWWSLAALLTVVVGLLCGPVATAVPPTVASGGTAPMVAAPFAAAPTASAAPAQAPTSSQVPDATSAQVPEGTSAQVPEGTSAQVPDPTSAQVPDATSAQAQAQAPAPALAPMAEDADAGTRVPGCGKLRDHDGEPAVPSRARSAYDQPPGLAPWGLPAATVVLPAEPPSGARARAPATHTPTPVELSVLRV
ncbi:hypothetical protein [Streptomyces sp. NPDC020330]|uniref:hypothetical protein n=1 Tax=unclassified Streptomyces TaxID=2593676 RepID=UPI0037B5FF28